MIVTDASALVPYILRERGFEQIRAMLGEGVIIDLVTKESLNAVPLAHRRGLVDAEQVQRSLEVLLALTDTNVKLHPQGASLSPHSGSPRRTTWHFTTHCIWRWPRSWALICCRGMPGRSRSLRGSA